MAKKPTPAPVAPQSSAQVEDRKNDSVAGREWINEAGEVVKNKSLATGFRYTLTDTGESIEEQVGPAGDWRTMYAIFGAHTKLGNEVNTQKAKGLPVSIAPARAFHDHVRDTGEWGIPGLGGGGPRVNIDRLIEAIHARADEKEANGESADRDRALSKLGSGESADLDYAKALLKNDGIRRHYDRLGGKAVVSDDEVF